MTGILVLRAEIVLVLGCLSRAIDGAEAACAHVLRKADFWQRFAREPFSERQKTVLNRYLDGFEGKLTAKGELHVGQGANCKAAVDAGTIVVDGVIEGNVTARERAKLNASAKVIGDITAKTLIVAEGATFTGRCQVGADAVERSLQQAEEKPLAVETRVTGVRPATAPRIPALAGVNGEAN